MTATEGRAKVFISCGQSTEEERVCARQIGAKLNTLDYDYYIAVEEQTLRGLKDNIFRQLETSEYFIFVDFKRESLTGSSDCRGSLFSHQELALASFLDIDVLAFQEEGVRREDGLMKFLQANCETFTGRDRLPDAIFERVSDLTKSGKWSSSWKNQLSLEPMPHHQADAHIGNPPRLAKFFHLGVKNHHKRKPAVNCYAYLRKAVDLGNGKPIPFLPIEFKWAGYIFPNAIIAPQSVRQFDAFYLIYQAPNNVIFSVFTDSGHYQPVLTAPGRYRLTYAVISENFPEIETTFDVHFQGSADQVSFSVSH